MNAAGAAAYGALNGVMLVLAIGPAAVLASFAATEVTNRDRPGWQRYGALVTVTVLAAVVVAMIVGFEARLDAVE